MRFMVGDLVLNWPCVDIVVESIGEGEMDEYEDGYREFLFSLNRLRCGEACRLC